LGHWVARRRAGLAKQKCVPAWTVYDLVGPSRDDHPSYRAYHPNSELNYHSDFCDVVGLLCLRKSRSGRQSKIVSTVAVYNANLRRRPDLAAELVKPWYIDRREEIRPGKNRGLRCRDSVSLRDIFHQLAQLLRSIGAKI